MREHCRLCGELKNIKYLNDDLAEETKSPPFTAMLKSIKIDFIDFTCDYLPTTVCLTCHSFVYECCNFFKKIESAQLFLTNIYKSAKTELKVEIKIENEVHSNKEQNYSLDAIKVKTNLTNNKEKSRADADLLKYDNKLKRKLQKKTKSNSTKKILNNSVDFLSQIEILELKNKAIDQISWAEYDWICVQCQASFSSMGEVRNHSKAMHTTCFGFQCNYCTELFNYFNPFVEHMRQHESSLKLFCQFCNLKFLSPTEASAHSVAHWTTSHICTLCGEMLPTASALEHHKKAYKKAVLPQRYYKKKPKIIEAEMSWNEYEWSCQDCSLSVSDIGSLRAHTLKVHGKCFAMKCADCLVVLSNHKQFVDHVTRHRECLKNYCSYCNIKLKSDVGNHLSTHISGLRKPCLGCGEIFPDSVSLMQHKTRYDVPRIRGGNANGADDFTCGVCLKVFPNGFQLKNHKVIHNDKRARDQICHTCGKAFFDPKTLTNHIKTHYTKTETCEICKKTFLTKQRLKVHITTHLELKQFVCNECEKKFRRKSQLRLHLASHSAVSPYKCATCNKSFRLPSYLKIHERQHTGVRPYSCEVCSETFNHWGNCNRHMIRKHGVTFARTKITARGKLDVNRETGEAKSIDVESNAQWCQEIMKPKTRGRKKKVES